MYVYFVPWYEYEPGWGGRPEEYVVYSDLPTCVRETRECDARATSPSGYYFGPQRPWVAYAVPVEHLPTEMRAEMERGRKWFPRLPAGVPRETVRLDEVREDLIEGLTL